jgi:hypothetical protein
LSAQLNNPNRSKEIAMTELNTYEDIEEFYAAEGYGCKVCGQLTSCDWFASEANLEMGDIWCYICKITIGKEVRAKFAKFPHRAKGVTVEPRRYNPASDGWAISEYQKNEHFRFELIRQDKRMAEAAKKN